MGKSKKNKHATEIEAYRHETHIRKNSVLVGLASYNTSNKVTFAKTLNR